MNNLFFEAAVLFLSFQGVYAPIPIPISTVSVVHETTKGVLSSKLSPTPENKPIQNTKEQNVISKEKVQKKHVVSSGESLASISKKVYGDEKYWVLLWNDNESLSDPTVLHSGDELSLREENISEEDLSRPLPSPTPTPTSIPTPTSAPAPKTAVGGTPGSFDTVYMDAGSKYAVPWQILYALHLLESGQRDGPVDSGVGPQGPMQFMPGTFAAYGVDGNGDGSIDINSAVDAIHSAANYLNRHGDLERGLSSYGNHKERVKEVARSRGWGG